MKNPIAWLGIAFMSQELHIFSILYGISVDFDVQLECGGNEDEDILADISVTPAGASFANVRAPRTSYVGLGVDL
jgi:hypothetical protein